MAGHDARAAAAHPRGRQRTDHGRGLLPRHVAGAGRPRPRGLDDEDDAEGARRCHARVHAQSRRDLPARARHGARAHEPGGGGAHEAAREHLPLGQHRARQRARDPLRPHGHRHLGGRGRGRDEAVRLHALQPRAGPRRPLHPDRSLLPQLEGARVRLLHGVHRARRQGERGDAVLLPLARLAGAQPPRPARDEGLADPRARRRVQAGHRRPARVARVEADLAAPERRRRRRRTTTRTFLGSTRRASSSPPSRTSRRPTTAS